MKDLQSRHIDVSVFRDIDNLAIVKTCSKEHGELRTSGTIVATGRIRAQDDSRFAVQISNGSDTQMEMDFSRGGALQFAASILEYYELDAEGFARWTAEQQAET